MQRERRNNPYPWTWEFPVGVACLVLLVLAVGVHVGNGLAQLSAGHGWGWPAREDLFVSIPGILTHAPTPLWAWIVAVEILLNAGLVWATVVGLRRWGPSRLKGVATRDEAEQVLGITRLKHVAPVVRPDLHSKRAAR